VADHGTNDDHETDDGLWAEFVREFEKNNAAHEPSAAERQAGRTAPPARDRRGRWPAALAAGLVVLTGVAAFLVWPRPGGNPAAQPVPSPTRSTPASAAPATSAPRTSSAPTSSAAPSGSAATAAEAPPTAAAPLSVFPAQVAGYTLVARTTNPTCTGPDTVAPTLAGLLTQGHGCLGVDLALYKDAAGDQFNLVIFTLKDPADALTLAMTLGASPNDYEVAVQVPPKDSGLRSLPADSGLVQTFSSRGHTLLVGLGQWADGRSSDFNTLVGKLTPLTEAVLPGTPT
jgi:hypothetical protein